MNSIVKLALAFAGGAAAGSGMTYLVLRKKNDKTLDDIGDKIEAAYKEKLEDAYDRIEKLNDSVEKYAKEEYERLTNPYRYHISEEHKSGIPDIPPEEEPYADEMIYEINLEDFMSDALFDKGYLTYYRGDGVLSSESDEMIEDPSYTLGEAGKNLAEIDADTLYIRNTRVGCDYQIDFVEGSYGKEVLGNED